MKKNVKTQHDQVTWKFTRTYINRYQMNQSYFKLKPRFLTKLQLTGVDSQLIDIITRNIDHFMTDGQARFYYWTYQDNRIYAHRPCNGKERIFAVYKIEKINEKAD